MDDLTQLMRCYAESLNECKDDLIKTSNILDPEENKKSYMKLLLNTFTKYIIIKANLNYRYISNDEVEICKICEKQFETNDICRSNNFGSTFKIENTCQCKFHAKCICDYLNTNKTDICPICKLNIPNQI